MSTPTINLVLAFALAAPPAASEATDLTAARAEAEAARKQSPSAATWGREAEVCERIADLACAREARTQQRALTPAGSPERTEADAKLAAIDDLSRGTVEGEPASTRRAERDRKQPALAVKPGPTTDRKPAPAPAKPDRIIKKWYFWVTIAAIAASGAAITALAVTAANDEARGADASAAPVRLDQGFGLRF